MKIIINEIPPSDNKFKGRQNVWEYRIEKERWLGVVWYACVGRKPSEPVKKDTVTITYFFPTRGRRDPDNYSGKFIIDGLVSAGIIQDDSFQCIDLRLKADYDKKNPRTEVEVTEK